MQVKLNDTIKKIFLLLVVLLFSNLIVAQINQQCIIYQPIEEENSQTLENCNLKTEFSDLEETNLYIKQLPSKLLTLGYPFASVDTFYQKDDFNTIVKLYFGKKITKIEYDYSSLSKQEISMLSGLGNHSTESSFKDFEIISEKLLDYYENNGFPFAGVYLDSVNFADEKIVAKIKTDKGVFYKIDSIHIEGDAKIKNRFLYHYLNIKQSSPYSKEKLKWVDKKISELPYLKMIQSSDLSMLGTGATLNLYLKSKKNSQFNFLIGLQPASSITDKFQLTGDLNLDLKNSFGYGENIIIKWQQLQPKAPRLNLGYVKPFIFNSKFNADAGFELFKKDSSFLQVNAQIGLQFSISNTQSGKVYMQWQHTGLLSGAIDTNKIKTEKKLPLNIDLNQSNIGFNYLWNNTNYKFNPKKGNDFSFISSFGIKTIEKNQDVISIKEYGFNYSGLYDSLKLKTYAVKLKLNYAHYFPLGRSSTIKASFNCATLFSSELFRNELYQIGGFNLLRGFDEESIYAKDYVVLSSEYRLIFAQNSFLSIFADYGNVSNIYRGYDLRNQYYSGGIGFLFETKAGLLNLNYAIGKRNDVPFKLREASKIHFGYINYF